jgi:hypothetical protein
MWSCQVRYMRYPYQCESVPSRNMEFEAYEKYCVDGVTHQQETGHRIILHCNKLHHNKDPSIRLHNLPVLSNSISIKDLLASERLWCVVERREDEK